MEDIFNGLHDFSKDTFYFGVEEGKARGRLDEGIKVRMKVIINLI